MRRKIPEAEYEFRMGILDHLEDLRWMAIRFGGVLLCGFLISWKFKEQIKSFITEPLIAVLPIGSKTLIFTTVPEGFFCYLWMCFIASVVFTSPLLFYQLWLFISPGFYKQEKKYLLFFIGTSSVLFLGGSLLAYFFVFPIGFAFFLKFGTENIAPRIRLTDYLDFSSNLLLAFGMIFETPLVILFLTKMGIIEPAIVAKQRKYVILIIFIVAAILTPPDVVTQLMMAAPLLVLFEISLFVSRFIH